MRKYEIMYVVRPNLEEEGRKAVIENFNNMFANMNSEVLEAKEWGMRDLAYAIEDFTKGYYVVLTVNATIEAKNEFDRLCGISEDVIRYIAIKEEK
ncbi:MAG TPA: 30S ribosomal protein S6 [Firmicutes bacterium]|nr:30S ribosomal protein S6 [Bacillota bacterium]